MSVLNRLASKVFNSSGGMISIFTTMVLMIVITLIVLGFAQLSRRNQRVTLDLQLSSQAFYAAETGINDVRNLLNSRLASGGAVDSSLNKSDCGYSGIWSALNPTIDGTNKVSYSCITVDLAPTQLSYSDVGSNSTIIPINSNDGITNIGSINLTVQSKADTLTPASNCSGNYSFPPSTAANWSCGFGILRFDLVPVPGTGFNLTDLRNSTMTTFAVPSVSGGSSSIAYAGGMANTNTLIRMPCSGQSCNLTITTGAAPKTEYYMRVSSVYKDVGLLVTANPPSSSANIELKEAQAVVDSTGKAGDVLRRVKVNIPLLSSSRNSFSDYALQSYGSICKQFYVMDGLYGSDPSVCS